MNRSIIILFFLSFGLNGICQSSKILESFDWVNNSRQVFTFDTNGNNTGYIQYKWNAEQLKWIENYRYQLYFDSEGDIRESNYQFWDLGRNDWINKTRGIYTYDTDKNLTEVLYTNWNNDLNIWINAEHYVYEYDTIGNRIIENNFIWDTEMNKWHVNRYAQSYDSVNNLTERIVYGWNEQSDSWIKKFQYSYKYDSLSNIIERKHDTWIENLNEWENSILNIFAITYDENGKTVEQDHFHWDGEKSEWFVSCYHYIWKYDNSGLLIEDISYQFWEPVNNEWSKISKTISGIVISENQKESLSYNWSNELNDWQNSSRSISTYDINGNLLERINYRWEEISTSISEIELVNNIKIYPIPFSEQLIVEAKAPEKIQKIELIDVNGKTVRLMENLENNLISIQRVNLKTGVYFLKIFTREIQVKKVIVN